MPFFLFPKINLILLSSTEAPSLFPSLHVISFCLYLYLYYFIVQFRIAVCSKGHQTFGLVEKNKIAPSCQIEKFAVTVGLNKGEIRAFRKLMQEQPAALKVAKDYIYLTYFRC